MSISSTCSTKVFPVVLTSSTEVLQKGLGSCRLPARTMSISTEKYFLFFRLFLSQFEKTKQSAKDKKRIRRVIPEQMIYIPGKPTNNDVVVAHQYKRPAWLCINTCRVLRLAPGTKELCGGSNAEWTLWLPSLPVCRSVSLSLSHRLTNQPSPQPRPIFDTLLMVS